MHQGDMAVCDVDILEALLSHPFGVNELKRLLKRNVRTIIKHLKAMERAGFVIYRKVGKKKLYTLTDRGKDACAISRIKREVGYVGLEWAEAKMQQGFTVRFLGDLTGLPQHSRWLFAWNPLTGECDLAAVFGVRSLKSKPGEPPRYYAQLVDREKSPDKPLNSAELFKFLKANVKDWSDEQNIQKALKSFWSLENFNAYCCAFTPEEVNFGFPTEIGHFSGLMFVGLGYQQYFPFIPRMTFKAGCFNLSENLKVQIEYASNLMMMHLYSWLQAKKVIDPTSIPDEALSSAKASTFDFKIGIACRNNQNGKCRKMGIKCIALSEGELDFSKCPILREEVKEVSITYSEKGKN